MWQKLQIKDLLDKVYPTFKDANFKKYTIFPPQNPNRGRYWKVSRFKSYRNEFFRFFKSNGTYFEIRLTWSWQSFFCPRRMTRVTFTSFINSNNSELIFSAFLKSVYCGFCSVCIYGFPNLPIFFMSFFFGFNVIWSYGCVSIVQWCWPFEIHVSFWPIQNVWSARGKWNGWKIFWILDGIKTVF